ncbi:MAG TPA: hypothetical protein VIO64_00075 [Pseudobacteroides sp.]|uniref:hypothetical protein n=1 Tax=Pseudobacteroides sp. TaxID=1968840 RepID=UPI002F93190D
MNKKLLYKKAYRILESSTPLKFDCGLVCDKKCCSGDNDSGMHLYPGEEMMHQASDFLDIRKEPFGDSHILFAVCNGSCIRKRRPLSCRTFPYAPYIDLSGKLTVIEDPRAKYLCPLLFDEAEIKLNRMFKRDILKVFRILIRDEEIKAYVHTLSRVLDEYLRFVL